MRNLILIWVSISLLASCSSNQDTSDLMLNDGNKWKVNEEMTPHIQQGNEIMNTYLTEKKTDFQELAKALKTQNSSLIKSCTMKGASHDELHKWLYPHIGFIKSLSSTSDSKEAEKIIIQIKESFETYQKYFE